jgi:Ca2+-binding RTX toxin-like protein
MSDGRSPEKQERAMLIFPIKTRAIYGTEGDDSLVGSSNNDTIFGYAGNDHISGGLGADRMVGGAGNDTYFVENVGDVVVENAGEGFDEIRSSVSYTIAANVEKLVLTGTAAINATGSSGQDYLDGNSSSNILWGLDGNDYLNGMQGTDTMIGGTGSDTYFVENAGDVVIEYANEGNADYVVSLISYTLGANVEHLTLGDAGAINGTGNELDNFLYGNGSDNVLTGGGGNDTLYGFLDDDKLFGGTGNDYLFAGAGDDLLDGGTGTDVLAGENGGDLFDWNSTNETSVTVATADLITDFKIAEGDRIDLSSIDANAYVAGDQAFTFIGTADFSGNPGELNYYHSGGETIIQLQTGTSADVEAVIRLTGTLTPDASWFAL